MFENANVSIFFKIFLAKDSRDKFVSHFRKMKTDVCSPRSLALSVTADAEVNGFVVIAEDDCSGQAQDTKPKEASEEEEDHHLQDSKMSSLQDDMIESRQDLEALDEEEDERSVSPATTHRQLQQVAQDLSKVVQIVTSLKAMAVDSEQLKLLLSRFDKFDDNLNNVKAEISGQLTSFKA